MRVRERWDVSKAEKEKSVKRSEVLGVGREEKAEGDLRTPSGPRQAGWSRILPPPDSPCFRLFSDIRLPLYWPLVAEYLQCTTVGPEPGDLLM